MNLYGQYKTSSNAVRNTRHGKGGVPFINGMVLLMPNQTYTITDHRIDFADTDPVEKANIPTRLMSSLRAYLADIREKDKTGPILISELDGLVEDETKREKLFREGNVGKAGQWFLKEWYEGHHLGTLLEHRHPSALELEKKAATLIEAVDGYGMKSWDHQIGIWQIQMRRVKPKPSWNPDLLGKTYYLRGTEFTIYRDLGDRWQVRTNCGPTMEILNKSDLEDAIRSGDAIDISH